MKQKIFDVYNKDDLDLLWAILPESVITLKHNTRIWLSDNDTSFAICPINIEWHNIKEINRPIIEATEEDIGKICEFWDNQTDKIQYKQIGVLTKINNLTENSDFKYQLADSVNFEHCRRLQPEEVQELY